MVSMAEWYGLKDERKDFTIENAADGQLLFARANLDDQLQAILRKSFRTGNPPKLVLFGDWGYGKTHTLRHIEYVISSNADFAAQCVFVELPDITAKSTFQVAHAALLDALGLDRAKTWMLQYQTKHQSKAQGLIQGVTQSEDIAKAFLTLISFGESGRICWDWLRGVSLSAADARSVGLAPVLDQSNQLVAVLKMLGRLSLDIDKKVLVLMIDEAAKLNDVTNGDSIGHWRNAFKLLADKGTRELGVVISASFVDVDDMPKMLADEQIRSRFSPDHYIQLNSFGPDEAMDFVSALLVNWVDSSKRDALLNKFENEKDEEDVSETSFPFTLPGREKFIEYACRNGNITNPRDLQSTLDTILNGAIDGNRHILSSNYMYQILTGP